MFAPQMNGDDPRELESRVSPFWVFLGGGAAGPHHTQKLLAAGGQFRLPNKSFW